MDRKFGLRTGLVFLLILILLVSGLACGEKKIKVRTGTKIVCKYGDLIKDDTRFVNVPASEASKYSVRTVRRLCDKHKKIEDLYRIAKQALAEGNEPEAKKAVKEIIKQEPEIKKKVEKAEDEDTKTQVEIIGQALLESERRAEASITLTAPESGEGQSSTSGQQQPTANEPTSSTPGEGQPGTSPAPVNLLLILPKELPGYSLISEGQSILAVSRLFSAINNPRVRYLSMGVQQFGTIDEVQGWIDGSGKLHHSVNARNIRIGNAIAYFGTDGREFAYLGWALGNVSVELEMLAKNGVPPKDLYDDIIDVAKKI